MRITTITSISSIIGAVLMSTSAQAEITGNISLTTDYIFRGISQTDQKPAVQGGFDYNHDSGFYAGVWASNVNFVDDVSIEVDYYLGYTGELSIIGWDVGIIHYDNPSDEEQDFDYTEYYLGVSWEFLSFTYSYSDDFSGAGTDEGHYYDLSIDYDLPYEISLLVHYGYSLIEDGAGNDDDETYNDWSIGVSKSWHGVDLGITYYDTSAVSDNFSGVDDCESICDSRVVFSISKEL